MSDYISFISESITEDPDVLNELLNFGWKGRGKRDSSEPEAVELSFDVLAARKLIEKVLEAPVPTGFLQRFVGEEHRDAVQRLVKGGILALKRNHFTSTPKTKGFLDYAVKQGLNLPDVPSIDMPDEKSEQDVAMPTADILHSLADKKHYEAYMQPVKIVVPNLAAFLAGQPVSATMTRGRGERSIISKESLLSMLGAALSKVEDLADEIRSIQESSDAVHRVQESLSDALMNFGAGLGRMRSLLLSKSNRDIGTQNLIDRLLVILDGDPSTSILPILKNMIKNVEDVEVDVSGVPVYPKSGLEDPSYLHTRIKGQKSRGAWPGKSEEPSADLRKAAMQRLPYRKWRAWKAAGFMSSADEKVDSLYGNAVLSQVFNMHPTLTAWLDSYYSEEYQQRRKKVGI